MVAWSPFRNSNRECSYITGFTAPWSRIPVDAKRCRGMHKDLLLTWEGLESILVFPKCFPVSGMVDIDMMNSMFP